MRPATQGVNGMRRSRVVPA